MSGNERRETHADIIEEMRCDADGYTHPSIVATKLNYFADRLEAAHRRESSKIVSKNGADFGQLGDAAKLREALEFVAHMDDASYTTHDVVTAVQMARAALAAPATAEKSSAVGDCAKMHEAMRLVSRVAVQMTRGTITGEAPTRKEVDDWAMRLCDIIGAALSAPPRNCVKIPMEVKHDNRKIR